MINNFKIKNFKGFNEEANIELKKINLFFGVNSAGKSSIIDAFRMVQHSGPFSLYTYNEDLDFDLGDAVDVLSGKKISYSIGTNLNKKKYELKRNFELLEDSNFIIKDIEVYCENKLLVKLNFYEHQKSIPSSGYQGEHFIKARIVNFIIDDEQWNELIKLILKDENYKKIRTFLTNIINAKESGVEDTTMPFNKISMDRLIDFRDKITKWKSVFENVAKVALSAKTNIPLDKIKNAELTKSDFELIAKASKDIEQNNNFEISLDDFLISDSIISYFEKDIISNLIFRTQDAVTSNYSQGMSFSFESNNESLLENLYLLIYQNKEGPLEYIKTILNNGDKFFKRSIYIPFLKNYQRSYQKRGRVKITNTYNSTRKVVDQLSQKNILNIINDWFENSSIKASFEILDSGEYKKLMVKDLTKKDGKLINIVDAGSGIRQLLPIILTLLSNFESITYYNNETFPSKNIILEEPEANLHPKLQIDLAYLIGKIASYNSIEKSVSIPKKGISFFSNDNFIIETHSEHMMLAFQKLIRKKKLSSEDLNVCCVVKDEDGHYIHKMEMNKNGDFVTEWPQGFFDERLDLIR